MTATIKKLLSKGLARHKAGDLPEAATIYRKVLAIDASQPDALYLLGMIALQRADNALAADFIEKALKRNPTTPEYHANLAIALQNLGRNEESVVHCRQALALRPDQFSVFNTLGNALMALDKREEAVECFQKAVTLKPDHVDINGNLANALRVMDKLDEAAEIYRVVIKLAPDHAEAYYNLASIQRKLSQNENALVSYRSALALKPDHVDAICGLADALYKLEQYHEAEEKYRTAISMKPDMTAAHNGLGNTLRLLGRMDEAIDSYHRALDIQPESPEYYCNISNVQFDMGLIDEAIESCERAIAIRPDFAEAHWNMGPALLAKGDFAAGWPKYDYRLLIKDSSPPSFSQPDWDGSSLKGRTLLVYAEQGVGDEIMFASCLPEVIDEADTCIVECDARLIPLFVRAFPRARFIMRGKGASQYPRELPVPDVKIGIASLPRYLRPSFSAFPQRQHYLLADPLALRRWKERLRSLGDGLKVGISWRGGKIAVVRRTRSTGLDQWRAPLCMHDVFFINLQYGNSKEEIEDIHEKFGVTIHDWDDSDPLTNLDDFSAKISALDLVISVDNSTVHMAGALGVPVWTLLAFGCDWRWMRNREDTPWYASMRLFRQHSSGDWDTVFRRVAINLSSLSVTKKPSAPLVHPSKDRKDRSASIEMQEVPSSYENR